MILLIRHGEAEHHVKALTGGWTDSCLTADGKVQMEKLAAVLKKDFAGRKPPRLAASDLQRCQLGAAILKKALGIKEMILFEALRLPARASLPQRLFTMLQKRDANLIIAIMMKGRRGGSSMSGRLMG